ncbi:MAG: ferredoxin--NADP reductase [Burkholderiales bacterium]|nr:ferredoxin--NADP reductase [Burkholderiales bacterium]
MSGWLEGRVIENRHWTEALFSLRVSAPRLAFEAGQFVRIALDVGPERIARPFSFVNPPHDPVLEFYGVVVPEGPLSPRLARLRAGDALWVADNPAGFLVLSEVPPAEDLWLVATGTGIAPFLSILRTETCWQRYRRAVLVHGVRHARELAYRELIEALRAERPGRLYYVPFVSREQAPGALAGRIPAAIRDGRLEAAALPIARERSQFMLCGNPQMLADVTAALAERGLRKHRRRTPGHISTEAFW